MGKPPPFNRPTVQIGKHGREWADVPVETLQIDDVVAGVGKLVRVLVQDNDSVQIEGGLQNVENYSVGHVVRAFVKTNAK